MIILKEIVSLALKIRKASLTMLDDTNRDTLEAAVLRQLLAHLRDRTDVQNIDLMGVGGFCRNCLSEWLEAAAHEHGLALDREAARSHIYGMSYADYKAKHQAPATPEQLARMEASVALNAKMRAPA
jgi:uncharacterized protein